MDNEELKSYIARRLVIVGLCMAIIIIATFNGLCGPAPTHNRDDYSI